MLLLWGFRLGAWLGIGSGRFRGGSCRPRRLWVLGNWEYLPQMFKLFKLSLLCGANSLRTVNKGFHHPKFMLQRLIGSKLEILVRMCLFTLHSEWQFSFRVPGSECVQHREDKIVLFLLCKLNCRINIIYVICEVLNKKILLWMLLSYEKKAKQI